MESRKYFEKIKRWLQVDDVALDYSPKSDKEVRAETLQQCKTMSRSEVVAIASSNRYLGSPVWHACQQHLDETNTEMKS
jgi:hypothetical protein